MDKFTTKTLRECFKEENILFKVTKYLALYPQCGGRGQQGINHAEAWTNQFNDYLYCASYFLNQLYSNVNVRKINLIQFKKNYNSTLKMFQFFSSVDSKYEGKFDISVFNLSELGQMTLTPNERYEKLTSVFLFFNTAIQSMLL